MKKLVLLLLLCVGCTSSYEAYTWVDCPCVCTAVDDRPNDLHSRYYVEYKDNKNRTLSYHTNYKHIVGDTLK